MSSEKCKLKRRDALTRLLGPNSGRQTPPSAGEDVEQWDSFVAGGDA